MTERDRAARYGVLWAGELDDNQAMTVFVVIGEQDKRQVTDFK
jgi:hypothetical protein